MSRLPLSSRILLAAGSAGMIAIALVLASPAKANDSPMNPYQHEVDRAWAGSRDLVAIAERYEGMTARQIGLPGRLWCSDFINYVRKKRGCTSSILAALRIRCSVGGGFRVPSPALLSSRGDVAGRMLTLSNARMLMEALKQSEVI